METGSKPKAPFWGFPLGLVSWTEQRSTTHMSDNIKPYEAYRSSDIWQKTGKEHTNKQAHAQSDLVNRVF